jgi:glycosyltransferase involved in cell wall biosynthesis
MWNNRRISVVFPAYNEEKNIVQAIHDFLNTKLVDEIIVVDNNSTDRTPELVAQTPARLVRETRQGFGYALQRGLREAKGDLIILCEPDNTFLGRDIVKFLAYCEDFDMVLGTRTTRELIWREANMGWFLRLGNVLVAKLLQFLHGGPSLSDCGCTYRLITSKARDLIIDKLSIGGSHFLPEMVIQALKVKIKIIEIPVNYRARVGESKITGTFKGTLLTGLRMIGLIFSSLFRK